MKLSEKHALAKRIAKLRKCIMASKIPRSSPVRKIVTIPKRSHKPH